MKPWVYVAPFAGMGLAMLAYGEMSGTTHAMREAHGICLNELESRGVGAGPSEQACDCMVGEATAWRDANPDAEYTRAVHQQLMTPCLSSLVVPPAQPQGWVADELPDDEPSDWGDA